MKNRSTWNSTRVSNYLRGLRVKLGLAVGGIPNLQSFYAHADMGRTEEQETSGHQPGYNAEDNADRIELIAIARQLEKDFAPVGYGISEIVKYIVPKAWRANSGDDQVDSILNRYIETEMLAERFDYSQRNDAPTCWRLLARDAMIDGDAFERLVVPRGEKFFFVQSVRGDLIGSITGADEFLLQPHQGKRQGNRRFRRVGGALLDARGRVRYWQKYREMDQGPMVSAGSGYVFEKNLPGPSVAQFMDPEHSDQYRGVTPLHDSAKEFRDLRVSWEYVRKNMEHGASIAGVVQNESGTAPVKPRAANRGPALGPDATTGACTSCKKNPCACPPRTQDVDGVKLVYLKTKEQMTQFKLENPGATFLDATKHLLRIGAWSLKMPAGILFDSAGLSGAPMRFELSKAGCSIEDQKLNVVKRLCAPWLRAKILEGIDNGRLPFKRSQLSQLTRGKWSFSEGPTADEKYRTSGYITLLEKGGISLQDVCEARGTNFPEVLQENASAAAQIYQTANELWEGSDKQLDISWWVDQLSMRGANGSVSHLATQQTETTNMIPSKEE